MIFLARLFGAPCPKKEQKILFAALFLEPRFLNFARPRVFLSVWRFAFAGLGLFGAPYCLDPALKQAEQKSVWGRALFGLDFQILEPDVFWRPWALWGPALKH
jgi:hypothetical protein